MNFLSPQYFDSERHHKLILGCFCTGQVLFWTLAPALTHYAPPLDVVEMLAWGQAGVVATYKHPNLPGLVLTAVRQIAFDTFWPFYLTAQIFVISSFIAVYLLGRDLIGSQRALAGTLLLTGIFYYSWPTPEMNHNIAQLPFWAGVCLALWRAVHSGQTIWWLALGLLAGLAMWAKYSSVLIIAIAFIWMVYDAEARQYFKSVKPWLALVVFAIIVAPLVMHLLQAPAAPIDFVLMRAGQAGGYMSFLLAQIADHTVFFIIAAAAGLFGTGAIRCPPEEKRPRIFLLFMGLGPVLLTIIISALTGLGLKDMWGTPMFNLSGLLLFVFLSGRFDSKVLRRLVILSGLLIILVPAGYSIFVQTRDVWSDRPSRVSWPQADIAQVLLTEYQSITGQMPHIIAGPVWEAGLIALLVPDQPAVLIDGDHRKSPWVSVDDLARQGALAVWQADAMPESLRTQVAEQPVRQHVFQWSPDPDTRPIKLYWSIIPPK